MRISVWSSDVCSSDLIQDGAGDRITAAGVTPMTEIIVSTTPSLEGRPAREYLCIVTGEVIVGANLFRDLFASVRDIVGGRSGAYEDVLQRAREQAIAEMRMRAATLGEIGRAPD